VFSSIEKATENVPSEFKNTDSLPRIYVDNFNERWLSIKEYEVEG
jgi:hypothetical protein